MQELRLKARMVQLSLAFTYWQRKAALARAAECQKNALHKLQTEQEAMREEVRMELTQKLETSQGEVGS